MTNTTLAVGILTFPPLLGAIYLSFMLQTNHSNNSSTENLKRLKAAHDFGYVFDDVLFGALPYQTFN